MDALSRFNKEEFWWLAPDADLNMTLHPHLHTNNNNHWAPANIKRGKILGANHSLPPELYQLL